MRPGARGSRFRTREYVLRCRSRAQGTDRHSHSASVQLLHALPRNEVECGVCGLCFLFLAFRDLVKWTDRSLPAARKTSSSRHAARAQRAQLGPLLVKASITFGKSLRLKCSGQPQSITQLHLPPQTASASPSATPAGYLLPDLAG